MTYADSVDLSYAQRMHRKIQELVEAGDKAEAIRLRRRYHEWLVSYHYHEVWRPTLCRTGRYRLVDLACTAGQSWGGS